MQDEEIDKLITDAANQHHPPYDDTAWGKMEDLLNQHLPQKNDKRRYVLFLLLFLLLGSGITIGILQPWKSGSTPIVYNGNNNTPGSVTPIAPANTKPVNDASQKINTNSAVASVTTEQQNNAGTTLSSGTLSSSSVTSLKEVLDNSNSKAFNNNKPVKYNKKGKVKLTIKGSTASSDDYTTAAEPKTGKNIITTSDDNNTTPTVAVIDVPNTDAVNKTGDLQKIASVTKEENASDKKTVTVSDETSKNKTAAAKSNKQTTDKRFASNIALTVSGGADVSYVELKNAGKTQLTYGAGLNYKLNKHLSVGSGVYVAKKVYTALPYQYKFASGYPNPNLKLIEADCKVYEIPVTLYYNFGASKNHQWFAAAGLSSLLMKRETYDYQYVSSGGVAYSYAKTIDNENKHYFSVLTVSGGYQYNLSNRISILAEPYLKLPLGGVGAGKIKLNSTGLLFTATIKPFAKAKK